jgi:predicted dehydrogenase
MERAKQVKIVIIGAGLIGPRHAESVVKCPDASLYAIVDPSPQAEAVAQHFNVPLYRDIDELLSAAGSNNDNDKASNGNNNPNNGLPDAAIVCTPNATHVPLSKRLLAEGIHVLVEKPVAITVESGLDLLRHAKAHESISGVQALAGHHRRFNPYVVAAHRALSSNSIGKPLAVSGLWVLRKPAAYYEAPTAWRASQDGGGPVLINLVHEIDILHYLLGPIVRVYAEQTLSTRGHDAEEGAAIVLKFESGVVGTFLLCDSAPSAHSFEAGTGENPIIPQSGRDFYRIFGSEGTLSVGDMKVERFREGGEGAWSDEVVEEDVEVGGEVPFDEQVGHLVRVVRGLERPRCSIGDGLRAVVVAEAVRRAMRTGVPVNVDGGSKL